MLSLHNTRGQERGAIRAIRAGNYIPPLHLGCRSVSRAALTRMGAGRGVVVVLLLLSAPLSLAGLLGAGDHHNTVSTCGTGWYGVCCRHGRGQLQGAALQSGDRGLARGLPGPRPLLLGVRILPRPGQVTC